MLTDQEQNQQQSEIAHSGKGEKDISYYKTELLEGMIRDLLIWRKH